MAPAILKAINNVVPNTPARINNPPMSGANNDIIKLFLKLNPLSYKIKNAMKAISIEEYNIVL